ncbi:MAG: XdhC family protein, partial [Chloroflexota bacterium]
WEVGLACGGNIKVFVEGLDTTLFGKINDLIKADRIGAVGTVIASDDQALVGKKLLVSPTEHLHGWDDPGAVTEVQKVLATGKNGETQLGEGTTLFVEVYLPAAQLIMVGGVHIAVALTNYAKILGYKTIVVDPRRAFGSDERFPHVDQLLQQWPKKAFSGLTINENTAVALLTHDPKIDDPALDQVLRSAAFYVGALGSSKTHAKRVNRLTEKGYSKEEIEKIHGPIGLNIHAQNPEEIALSIMAEIIKARRS